MIINLVVETLAVFGFQTPAEGVKLPLTSLDPSQPTESSEPYRLNRSYTLAAHRSHASHSSHRSGASGIPRAPRVTSPPIIIQRATPPPKPPESTGRNTRSTPPSSILPSSPANTKLDKVKGNSKAFKLLLMKTQLSLYALGFYSGSIDGISGSETKAAISSYQNTHGLPVTGSINDELLDSLKITID